MKALDQSLNLRLRIERYDALKRAYTEAERFRHQADDLRELHQKLSAGRAKRDALVARGIDIDTNANPGRSMQLLETFRKAMSDESSDGGIDFAKLKRSARAIAKRLESSLEKAIKAVKDEFHSFDEAYLQQVELIPGYSETVARIRQQRNALLQGTDPVQMAPATLADFLDRRESLRNLSEEVQPEDFPAEVREFFRATRRQEGAPLEKFTETVRAWLQEKDLLKDIRVRMVPR